MKRYYSADVSRGADGSFCVDDDKFNWCDMTELQFVLYWGSMLGAIIEHMRMTKASGQLKLDIYVDEKVWEGMKND